MKSFLFFSIGVMLGVSTSYYIIYHIAKINGAL